MWGLFLIASAVLGFFGGIKAALFSDPDEAFLRVIILLAVVVAMVTGLFALSPANSPVNNFSWSWKKFGRNFSWLCALVDKKPAETVDLDKETLRILALNGLADIAKEIVDLEKKISDAFRELSGSDTSKDGEVREEARDRLWDYYNAVKKFDLIVEETDEKAYEAIFAAARQRSAKA